ncbi:hypothetical protein LIS82_12100 [Cytobacillus solani]|uniref:phage lytic cycle repressor MrpR family protein n=1 Tax=Cytobacillus solani TaxID=1637975 RepID=UPI00207A16E5|nr:hypothetical protein [Cytobacillus solani]USK57156.1 hypothetical protein LIS82_12100 [Cytobacillus solani]
MNKMYNEDIKWRFLNEKYDSKETREVIKYIFFYAYLNELPLGKDLYDFSLDQIGSVIANSNPKSLNVAKTRGSFISQYISWAISPDVNLRRDNLNPLQNIDESWYAQFVDTSLKQFISKTELDEMVSQLVNYQDKIIPVLLFNGVYGTESSEIRNLKLTDIQEDGTTRLYDDVKGERYIKLDENVIEMLRKANYEEVYMNKNGMAEGKSPNSHLVNSEFIVKSLKRGAAKEGHRISQSSIISRINIIKEYIGWLDLTPKSIWRSGMLYMASQLMQGRNELIKEDFDKIGEHFNLSKINNNGYESYNRAYMSGFINEENINKLYK